MFPICIKAVSEYLGDDVSYAYIMAATGAAFRLTWNRTAWDLSNIDMFHALRESNDIYQFGAKALGREFSFLGRDEKTTKEEFTAYMKSNIAKGYPVIALGIIGPPESCIVAGYESAGDVLVGWNFFQNDSEFASAVDFMDNGYFRCDAWWENTDTQAAMCIGPVTDESYGQKEIIKMAAAYFEEIAEKYGSEERKICLNIAEHFKKVSNLSGEMMSLIGDWSNTENMLQNLASRSVREQLGKLIESAECEDTRAYEQIKMLLNR